MQVNQVSYIEVIDAFGTPIKLNILQNIHKPAPGSRVTVIHLVRLFGKHTHFIWHDPDARPVTQKMRDWVADVFPQIFDTSNKMLLFASIGTAPLELREQLKDLFNDQTIIHG
jgi:hypothetical protein